MLISLHNKVDSHIMELQEKTRLINLGNQALKAKAPFKAGEFYEKANFQPGILEVGNYFYNDRKPLIAYKYYKLANQEEKLEQLHLAFTNAIKIWMTDDDKDVNLSQQISPQKYISKNRPSSKA